MISCSLGDPRFGFGSRSKTTYLCRRTEVRRLSLLRGTAKQTKQSPEARPVPQGRVPCRDTFLEGFVQRLTVSDAASRAGVGRSIVCQTGERLERRDEEAVRGKNSVQDWLPVQPFVVNAFEFRILVDIARYLRSGEPSDVKTISPFVDVDGTVHPSVPYPTQPEQDASLAIRVTAVSVTRGGLAALIEHRRPHAGLNGSAVGGVPE